MKIHLSLIKTTNAENFYSESKVRQFTISADEPITNQGTDLAPAPLDLLNASLASCTASYLRYHANMQEIDTGKIEIKIKIRKDEESSLLFERTILFEKNLSNEEQHFLLEKAQRTPVTKIIMNSQLITTTIN